ncbi:MAG: single-stranded DNA-binding protein [Sphaerochaeta sp.]|nr:single-stranded DNA-binding protein [Sphaerochaeta sp.]
MNDINTVTLAGRLTRDIELKFTDSGYAVGRFSLAVNKNRKRGDKWEEEVSFFSCVLYGKSAENLEQYMTKGKQLVISGFLRQERWESNGDTRSRIDVVVETVMLLGGGKDGDSDNRNDSRGSRDNSRSRGNDRSRNQSNRSVSQRNNSSRQGNLDDREFNQGGRRGFDPPAGKRSGFPGPEDFDDDIPF